MKTYEVRGHGVSGNPITRKFTSRMRAVQAAKLSLSYNGFCPVSRRWDDGATAVYRDRLVGNAWCNECRTHKPALTAFGTEGGSCDWMICDDCLRAVFPPFGGSVSAPRINNRNWRCDGCPYVRRAPEGQRPSCARCHTPMVRAEDNGRAAQLRKGRKTPRVSRSGYR